LHCYFFGISIYLHFLQNTIMRYATLLLMIVFSTLESFSQTTQIDCLTVRGSDGAVSIRFSGPTGTTAFEIYRSQQINGTYTLIHTTENGSFRTYLDTEINAASQSYSYYIRSLQNGQSIGESEKNRTILLNVTDLENGQVQLSWNDPGITLTESYEIWRKKPGSSFEHLNSTTETSYRDTLEQCTISYNYQIQVNTTACTSKSNLKGGTYHDFSPPDDVLPKVATVDTATGEIVLSWLLPSAENADIEKYQIWEMNDDGSTSQFPLAEVNGYHHLSIRLNEGLVCDTTITFSITAIDSCGNSSVWNPDYFIRTLNMHNPEYDICNDACLISWDSIYNWNDMAVEGIKVFRKTGEGAFEEIAQVSPSENIVFVYGFKRDVKYQFYIEAFSANNERKSTSCIKSIVGKRPINTAYTWLRKASVENGEVELLWQIDNKAFVREFAILRSEDGQNFNVIDTLMGSNDTIYSFFDAKSTYYKEPQYYQIRPFDSCLNIGDPSNTAKTIYTKVTSYSDGNALVEWTPYEGMEHIETYNIYRFIDTLMYPFPIGEVNPNDDLSYVDNYGSAVPLSAKVGYLVEVVGKLVDSLTIADSAKSNSNYLAKASNLFLPSGFYPLSNSSSKYIPIYTGIKDINYSFKILNRWGMLIFEANHPVLGWDGKFQKEYVPAGGYVYVVDYETIYGKKTRKSGMFFVLYK